MEKFRFLEGNLNQPMPFQDSFFDAVTCIGTLVLVFDPFSFIKESHRILRKGGLLIIQVPNSAYIKYRLNLLFGKFPKQSNQIGWHGGILHYFTFASLSKFLQSEGFTIEKKLCSGTFIPVRRLWLPLLAADIIIKARKV